MTEYKQLTSQGESCARFQSAKFLQAWIESTHYVTLGAPDGMFEAGACSKLSSPDGARAIEI